MSETEIFEPKKGMKHSKDCISHSPFVKVLDDTHQKEKNDPRVQAMFERSRRSNFSFYIISQEHYKLPEKNKMS